jgi:mannosyl-3-phosphoglycerate phosphatase
MGNNLRQYQPQILIFTDLDGTLLDDQTYDFSPALPALKIIHSQKIPLILVSSKTRTEIEFLRELMSFETPFIAENGGGIYFPNSYALPHDYPYTKVEKFHALFIGRPIKEVLERSRKLKGNFNFKGFSEMSVKEIASLTGLTLEDALRASKREFDEPILLEDPLDDGEIFCKKAAQHGLDCVHGGRFIHLFIGGNKGRAVKKVLDIYKQRKGATFSIALGDSPNDISMLKAVDKAVVMQGRDGTYIKDLDHPDIIKAEGNGPVAWNRVMLSILEDLRNRKLMTES